MTWTDSRGSSLSRPGVPSAGGLSLGKSGAHIKSNLSARRIENANTAISSPPLSLGGGTAMSGIADFVGMLFGRRPPAEKRVDEARSATDKLRDEARNRCKEITPEDAIRGLVGERRYGRNGRPGDL